MTTRTDLPYLRRRVRPAAAPVPPALKDFISGHATGHHPTVAATTPVPPAAPTVSASLDLSSPPAAPSRPKAVAPKTAASPHVRRVRSGASEVLTPKEPTVTLTRLQSGVGGLVFEAACSDAVGDLRLGCAYVLSSEVTSVVQEGVSTAPAKTNRPVLVGKREQYERITLDLAQVRSVDRLGLYAFSASHGELSWGGTLVVTTFGGARIELPMDGPVGPGVRMLLTVYDVDGELVLRAETPELVQTTREACVAFGFDRITWLDPFTPVV